MKIYVNARFLTQPISGVQRYAIECSLQIKKQYPETTFLCPSNIISEKIAKTLNVEIIGKNKGHIWEQFDLPNYLKIKGNPALLNLANTAPLSYINNFITIHDLAFFFYPQWNSKIFSTWYNFLIPRLAKSSKHIFTVSNTIKKEIIEAYKIEDSKITLTYNGISSIMEQYNKSPNQMNNGGKEKIILSVGTFNERKNHLFLVKGYLQSEIRNEYKLILVGDKNKIFSKTGMDENMLVDNRIEVVKNLSETDLVEMYHKAEIVVSISKYEGFGIPILEGLYSGCKVLCSDIEVYRELYNDFTFFCNPLDINNISEALKNISLQNNTYGNHALDKLLSYCNYEVSANSIINTLIDMQ